MYSVTSRIARIKQPYGGFIKRTDFDVSQLNDNHVLHEPENISPALVGTSVDYMTRFMMGAPVGQAFEIPIKGAHHANADEEANVLTKKITGLNIESVSAACKLAGYDVCYRVGMSRYKPVAEINPDDNTIKNIIVMVNRSVDFWNNYGPIVLDGFTFEGGYTPIVSAGDGDFLTKDTLWDFKVLRHEPNSKYTLQLLMYYIMGKHSTHKEFASVEYIGLFNPRKNKAYRYSVKAIPQKTISIVSHDVIGYGWKKEEYDAFFQNKLGLTSSHTLLKKENTTSSQKNIPFKKGDRIFHKKFGKGIILSINSNGQYEVAEVKFDSSLEKRIVASYLEHTN
jgi:hypothetical protein